MKLTYRLEFWLFEEKGNFGIEVYEDGALAAVYRDLPGNRRRVARFCKRCNHAYVSRVHLKDIMEDFYYEESHRKFGR